MKVLSLLELKVMVLITSIGLNAMALGSNLENFSQDFMINNNMLAINHRSRKNSLVNPLA